MVPDPEPTNKTTQQLRNSSSKTGGSSEDIRKPKQLPPNTAPSNPYTKRPTPPYNGKQPSSTPRPPNAPATKRGGPEDGAPADEMSQCRPERRPVASPGGSEHCPPRKGGTKVKVCGGTQTSTSDLYSHSDSEYSSLGRPRGYAGPPLPKQYFMTTPGPGTGLKERVYGSRAVLNGSPTPLSDYVMMRGGRLSGVDRDYEHGAYSSWMRHSPSCGTAVAGGGGRGGGTLTEADSMESLSSTSSSIHAQVSYCFP